MPELPEVETIRNQLAPVVQGRPIELAEVRDARWCAPQHPGPFTARLAGRTIEALDRRGKYFVMRLDDGAALIMHLRMTGNLLFVGSDSPLPSAHLRGLIELDGGDRLAFVDPRRFGTAEIIESPDALGKYFSGRLGPEPFGDEFTPEQLFQATRRRKTSIKAVLLDQRVVAGIGNIYADEALFRAEIAPHRRADRLTRAQAASLRDTIRQSLTAGIDAKGASIDDFRDAYGVQGSFQDQFLVHRRAGLPCPNCGTSIVKTRVAGRGTYHCKNCQTGRAG
ncbi:MAG TPA: bifunctional DNA-formamidopyrimidine glycosylase/DNA-(apurinic or apyrimidinic site) lyase [Solirubrobacterales bacterium]|nr:bifunctional DNA-formamidopyrimidine glycosylase/DNA-(apurinic or apyrimidinic site) lyase [Solirubrobacterales bacterium]